MSEETKTAIRFTIIVGLGVAFIISLAWYYESKPIIKLVPVQAPIWRITAYCPNKCCCGQYADYITASGHRIEPGDKFCAAPPEIPFGTVLDIPGYGRVPVLDRGGAIKERRLDVFFDDKDGVSGHQRALNWGVKYLRIKL